MNKLVLAIFILITLFSFTLVAADTSLNELSKLNNSKIYNCKKSYNFYSLSWIVSMSIDFSDLDISSIIFERFISLESPFSWSIAATVWFESDLVIPMINSNVYCHPFKNSFIDPYIGIGVTMGYNQWYGLKGDFPLTVGISLWFFKNLGIKTQARFFPLHGKDSTIISMGIIRKLTIFN